MVFRVGCHVSIAGGFSNVLDRIEAAGGNCGQIFNHPPQSWHTKELDESDTDRFRKEYKRRDIRPVITHSSYLINIGSPNPKIRHPSLNMLMKELKINSALGIEYLNFHPGAYTTSDLDEGIKNIIRCIDKISDTGILKKDRMLLLENTAGKGTTIGTTFEELKRILENIDTKYVGVCLDTAHSIAAGFDLTDRDGVDHWVDSFDDLIGLEKLKCIHTNDSKVPLGSKKDLHEHIGLGYIGERGFKAILNNKKIRDKPFILETPFDERRGDIENITAVKRLAGVR